MVFSFIAFCHQLDWQWNVRHSCSCVIIYAQCWNTLIIVFHLAKRLYSTIQMPKNKITSLKCIDKSFNLHLSYSMFKIKATSAFFTRKKVLPSLVKLNRCIGSVLLFLESNSCIKLNQNIIWRNNLGFYYFLLRFNLKIQSSKCPFWIQTLDLLKWWPNHKVWAENA